MIGITGHTSGIGLAFSQLCDSYRKEWKGFSTSNGYDIKETDRIVSESLDCDIFINNAYSGLAQVNLLYELWDKWQDMNKQIICIGSIASDLTEDTNKYTFHKGVLDQACLKLQIPGYVRDPAKRCRITNIKPGWVATATVKTDALKMEPAYIAKLIMWIIKQPHHIMTLRVNPFEEKENNA